MKARDSFSGKHARAAGDEVGFMLRRVLIADREPAVADTLAAWLTLRGLEARTAYDGNQAVTAARIWCPDVFLADAILPEISGIEAANTVCRKLPKCRVLLAAEPARMATVQERARGLEILEKPIEPGELLQRLERRARSRPAA